MRISLAPLPEWFRKGGQTTDERLPDLISEAHMAKRIYTDAFGQDHECDDEITLLGPHVPVIGTSAESNLNPRYQPIRDPYGDRQRALERESRKTSGFSNPVDDAEYIAQHWPSKGTV